MTDGCDAMGVLFDMMEAVRRLHPEMTDEECFDAVCFSSELMRRLADIERDHRHDR